MLGPPSTVELKCIAPLCAKYQQNCALLYIFLKLDTSQQLTLVSTRMLLNRYVVDIPQKPTKPSLPEANGLAYILLYSPARISACARTDRIDFTSAELERFQMRYDNVYDLKDDICYNQWLRISSMC